MEIHSEKLVCNSAENIYGHLTRGKKVGGLIEQRKWASGGAELGSCQIKHTTAACQHLSHGARLTLMVDGYSLSAVWSTEIKVNCLEVLSAHQRPHQPVYL